ncbi:MAG: hypothetical protein OXD50_09265 [Chloroflexi bacterium]|nr:hypothetical protein [Chloroflexota bacterium]
MAVLGSREILNRLANGDVFAPETWKLENIKEASYALSLAWDGLVVDGKPYPPGSCYPEEQIRIDPGKIAILSTEEKLQMPADLSGKVGVRLEFAAVGLLGLMGIQVDPYYGFGHEEERLYFRVANVSNETIRLQRTDHVFNIELLHAVGAVRPAVRKEDGWQRMQRMIRNQHDTSWTYITRLKQDVDDIEERFQNLILFGVLLVAVTILGVISAVMITADATSAPAWFASWGWVILLVTFAAGGIATATLVGMEAWHRGVKALAATKRLLR